MQRIYSASRVPRPATGDQREQRVSNDVSIDQRLRRGEIVQVGGKLMAVCQSCGVLIRVDKPLLGSLHFCAEDREG